MIDIDSAPRTARNRRLAAELERQPASVVDALVSALRSLRNEDRHRGQQAELDPGIWGSAPAPVELERAAASNLLLGLSRRQAVMADSLRRSEVAHLLGKSDQAVSDMLERGALLGLKHGREWRIPAWQLAADLPAGVLPGLPDLNRVWHDGVVALSEWVGRPHPDLDDHTPRESLAGGEVDRVLAAARGDD